MSGDVIPGLKNINILRYLAYNKKNFFFFFRKTANNLWGQEPAKNFKQKHGKKKWVEHWQSVTQWKKNWRLKVIEYEVSLEIFTEFVIKKTWRKGWETIWFRRSLNIRWDLHYMTMTQIETVIVLVIESSFTIITIITRGWRWEQERPLQKTHFMSSSVWST